MRALHSAIRALRILSVLCVLFFPAHARAQAPNCDKLREAASAAQKEVETARAGGKKDEIAAAEKKYSEALAKWRACPPPPPPPHAGGAPQAGQPRGGGRTKRGPARA